MGLPLTEKRICGGPFVLLSGTENIILLTKVLRILVLFPVKTRPFSTKDIVSVLSL